MIFNIKVTQNNIEFHCEECKHDTFVQYHNHAEALTFACEKCHATHDAELLNLSEVEG